MLGIAARVAATPGAATRRYSSLCCGAVALQLALLQRCGAAVRITLALFKDLHFGKNVTRKRSPTRKLSPTRKRSLVPTQASSSGSKTNALRLRQQ
ncbi:unnamed protein product [Sphagnum jensenii]|uniref:Secreted protein n=1 Tax=Sphagnum jensenii TaxID=128206 RepID=A0ABP1BMR7_9BRYO